MIRLQEIRYQVGSFRLDGVDLHVRAGEYFVLLGPPGSGKTVLLECLCGLRRIDGGRIIVGEQDVTHLEPRLRQIAYVPQDYALFPHRNVDQNIAFGLRRQHAGRDETAARVLETAAMLGIEPLLGRAIAGLSGGEKQRVALARALVMRRQVLLLDEPVCALDEAIRQEICSQLRSLQQQLGLTAMHVSHNLEEAFLVADRAAVMRGGDIQQIGTMSQLLRQPANEFVARFMRCENILSGVALGPAEENRGRTPISPADPASNDEGNRGASPVSPPPVPGRTLVQCGPVRLRVNGRHTGPLKVMVRPENLRLLAPQQSPDWLAQWADSFVRVRLAARKDCGSYLRLELDGPLRLVAHCSHAGGAHLPTEAGAELIAWLPPEDLHVMTA